MSKQLDMDKPEFWEEIYQGGRAGWDLGGPTPAFIRLLQSGLMTPGRMLVTCAGRGHDARAFARYGFQVDAVEFAAEPVRDMQALADPNAPVHVVQADLFTLSHELDGQYDYVLEYTCYCAINPARRPEYADLIARLLKPHGILIALIFPTTPQPGGPPFYAPIDQVMGLFQSRGFQVLRQETPGDSVPQRKDSEALLILQKADEVTK
ncbi:MAG TPA: methyltransferase domain-containing protein [Anaerolineae bacterium]